MPRTKPKPSKPKVDPTIALALATVPAIQVANDRFEICDVSNHSERDQRHMVRSGQRKTVRRTTKIDQLLKRGILDQREALACEWYQSTYENEYETRVKIADWSATGGSSDRAYGHWPAGLPLEPGLSMHEFARRAISPMVLPMFERVVLHGRPLGKLAITFRQAARQLLQHIEGKVAL